MQDVTWKSFLFSGSATILVWHSAYVCIPQSSWVIRIRVSGQYFEFVLWLLVPKMPRITKHHSKLITTYSPINYARLCAWSLPNTPWRLISWCVLLIMLCHPCWQPKGLPIWVISLSAFEVRLLMLDRRKSILKHEIWSNWMVMFYVYTAN